MIVIGHPAHVHLFRNAVNIWRGKGNQVLIAARDKEIAIDLLKIFKLDFKKLTKKPSNKFGFLLELPVLLLKIFKIIFTFKPSRML